MIYTRDDICKTLTAYTQNVNTLFLPKEPPKKIKTKWIFNSQIKFRLQFFWESDNMLFLQSEIRFFFDN